MPDWDDLPPRVRERLSRIGEATPEEREMIKERQELESLLAAFHKRTIDEEELFNRLKACRQQGKQYLLREAKARLEASSKKGGLRIKFEEVGDTLDVSLMSAEEAKAPPPPAQGEAGAVLELTSENFEQVIARHPLIVVDCWAPWCGPCRMVTPVIEELAAEYDGRIAFAKLNVDQNQAIAARYGIMSIPTLLVFKDGALVAQKVGALPKSALEAELAAFLQ